MTHKPTAESLLPCPFCGESPKAHQNDLAHNLWRYRCENCDAGPHGAIGTDAAAEAWNRRAAPAAQPEESARCACCGLAYISPAFADLVIDNEAWKAISPDGEGNGLLCPNCICARLHEKGLEHVRGTFRSGPLAVYSNPDPDGWVTVPRTALDWLFGEGPDQDGNHFGDDVGDSAPRYWWRPKFRAMLSVAQEWRETFIVEEPDGPPNGILIDLTDGSQVWTGECSDERLQEARDAEESPENSGQYLMLAEAGKPVRIIAQVASVEDGMTLARALARSLPTPPKSEKEEG